MDTCTSTYKNKLVIGLLAVIFLIAAFVPITGFAFKTDGAQKAPISNQSSYTRPFFDSTFLFSKSPKIHNSHSNDGSGDIAFWGEEITLDEKNLGGSPLYQIGNFTPSADRQVISNLYFLESSLFRKWSLLLLETIVFLH